MNLPNFIICGAARAGTTMLYKVLDEHPDIYMAKPMAPEPKYFRIDEEYAKGLEHYSSSFFADANHKAVGEKSTMYMEHPSVAERIRRDLPDVKLVFVLRNPIERAYSNHLWSSKHGFEDKSFEEAVRTEAEREAAYPEDLRYTRPFSYVARGMYANLLTPYFELFDVDQMKFIVFEEMLDRPVQVMTDLLNWLGVSPSGTAINVGDRVNTARFNDETVPVRAWEYLNEIYWEPNRELAELIGANLTAWSKPPAGIGDSVITVLPFDHGLPDNRYNRHAWIIGDPQIGEGTWIGAFTLIDGQGGLTIGKGCDISAGARIMTHTTVRRCLTERKYPYVDRSPTVLEDHVFVGSNAVILKGCRIGHHSIIGAGAVVLEDTIIPPYSMVVGVPGRVTRDLRDQVDDWIAAAGKNGE